MALPEIRTREDYTAVYRNEAVWLGAMRRICDRHGIDASGLGFAPPGTHVVFHAGRDLFIKLFCPLWSGDHAAERAVLGATAAHPELPVPRLVAEGRIDDWPYLVLTSIPGTPFERIADRIDGTEREAVFAGLGRFLAALHGIPTAGLRSLEVDWAAFARERISERIREIGALDPAPRFAKSVVRFLEDLPARVDLGGRHVLLSADVTDEHVLVEERNGRCSFSGYVDFGDALLGPPLHEFAAPAVCLTQGSPDAQLALLRGYGLRADDLDRDLAVSLTAHVLLHRYIRMEDLSRAVAPAEPSDIDGVVGALWSFG